MDDEDEYYLGSDDPQLQEVLETSRLEYEASSSQARAGPSTSTSSASFSAIDSKINILNRETAQISAELAGYEEDLKRLHSLISVRKEELAKKNAEIESLKASRYDSLRSNQGGRTEGSKGKGGIDYGLDGFPWTNGMKARMKQVFGIDGFRLCQQGACNANMDGRDIVCVMPTGGGKSLTYQLPALLAPGVTIVISPLISLISDQIMHLKDAGVPAVKLTGSTSKTEAEDVDRRLKAMIANTGSSTSNDIKLIYVTPEKIAKSKRFVALLQKLDRAQKLARLVIDEAHCVSMLGHDFRPDYQKLRVLRQLFPQVPIMALSATCPPLVLQDLLKVLGLSAVTDGNSAGTKGTVYFSSPLYRKNLHYTVVQKSDVGNKVYEAMVKWILEKHEGESGIVYCFSKKDTEKLALALQNLSSNRIKTGVYHADKSDREKEDLHKKWREGHVKVVVATIAFGLGIDKGDVRFVLHHSISKSLDGFYQESGRAGRDGKDSDCVLYYRPQDASNLSSMMVGEKDGPAKLHAMLSFAQDLQECRKLQFAKYFSHSTSLSLSSWSTDSASALDKCGHCDNCTRSPGSIVKKDVTFEAWQILKLLEEIGRHGGDVTVKQLGEMCRGVGLNSSGAMNGAGGGGEKKGKGKGKEKSKMSIDMERVCGGKVEMKQDDTERLIIELLLKKYLKEEYHTTAYATTAYLRPGDMAFRLTRLSKEALSNPSVQRLECAFLVGDTRGKEAGRGRGRPKKTKDDGEDGEERANLNDWLQPSVSDSGGGQRKKGPAASASASTSATVPKKRGRPPKASASSSVSASTRRSSTRLADEDEDLEDFIVDDGDAITFESDIDEQDPDSSPIRVTKSKGKEKAHAHVNGRGAGRTLTRTGGSMQEPIDIDDDGERSRPGVGDIEDESGDDWSFGPGTTGTSERYGFKDNEGDDEGDEEDEELGADDWSFGYRPRSQHVAVPPRKKRRVSAVHDDDNGVGATRIGVNGTQTTVQRQSEDSGIGASTGVNGSGSIGRSRSKIKPKPLPKKAVVDPEVLELSSD